MKGSGYTVRYWLGGYLLRIVNCDKDAGFAWRMVDRYYSLGYKPWLEYKKEAQGGKDKEAE